MGGIGFQIWLADNVNLSEILPSLGWIETDLGFERTGLEYWARVTPPRPVFAEDIPEAIDQILPGISSLIELFSEGRSESATRLLSRSANAIAKAGHGVISDGHEAWLARGVRRAVQYPNQELRSPQLVVMSWWAAGGPLSTRKGISELMSTLQRFLPEALPDKWDHIEPPSHRLSVEGTENLIDFVDGYGEARELTFLWPKRPVYDLQLSVSWWGGPFTYYRALFFRIGIDARLLLEPGWPRQFPRAFREISRVIQPFYGEARLDPDVSRGMVAGEYQPHPASSVGSWFGVPQFPPFAMVIGPPYLDKWATASSGELLGEVVLHSSDNWPTPPAGECPRPPDEIVQEPDYSVAILTPDQWPESYRQKVARSSSFSNVTRSDPDSATPRPFTLSPDRKPLFWPFPEERYPDLYFGKHRTTAEPR